MQVKRSKSAQFEILSCYKKTRRRKKGNSFDQNLVNSTGALWPKFCCFLSSVYKTLSPEISLNSLQ